MCVCLEEDIDGLVVFLHSIRKKIVKKIIWRILLTLLAFAMIIGVYLLFKPIDIHLKPPTIRIQRSSLSKMLASLKRAEISGHAVLRKRTYSLYVKNQRWSRQTPAAQLLTVQERSPRGRTTRTRTPPPAVQPDRVKRWSRACAAAWGARRETGQPCVCVCARY